MQYEWSYGCGDDTRASCRILSEAHWPPFQITFFLLSYVVPLALTCGLYIAMLLRLWRQDVRNSVGSRSCRKHVTRLVVVVVGVFAACWMPIQVGRLRTLGDRGRPFRFRGQWRV